MRGDVEEQMRKLWSRILRTMRRREAENQHYRFAREILLRLSQEGHRVVSNQVGIVVLKTQGSLEMSALLGYYVAYSSKYAVVQLLEALRYKPEGRGFDSRWCHWNFLLTYSFRPH